MVGFFHLYVKLIAQLKAHGDVCERSTKRISHCKNQAWRWNSRVSEQKFAEFKEKTGAEVIHLDVNIEVLDDHEADAFIESVFVSTDL